MEGGGCLDRPHFKMIKKKVKLLNWNENEN